MIEIIPAIMPKSYEDLVEKTGLFSGLVPMIQLDIMDGKFVKGRTWPHMKKSEKLKVKSPNFAKATLGTEKLRNGDAHFEAIVKEGDGMPNWDTLDFEVDLMINDPELWVPKWVIAGARRIIVHQESIKSLKNFEIIREAIPGEIIELGIAINTRTSISILANYRGQIDFVQCMGIAHIGLQGETLDEKVFDQIQEVRKMFQETPISVDGGVNYENAKQLVAAGATRLVSGSVILESDDTVNAIKRFQDLVV